MRDRRGGAAADPARSDDGEDPATVEVAVDDGAVTVQNPCLSGGAIEVFLEPVLPAPRVLVVGDTPIAAPSLRLGARARARRSSRVRRRRPRARAPATSRSSSPRTGATSCTRCAAALEAGVPYVGLVASRKRGAGVLAELRGDGVPEEQLARIDVPAGLDIGARTPAEIALSILAGDRRRPPRGSTPARRPRAAAPPGADDRPRPPLAVDPICGMTVAAVASTPSVEHDGETVYFCCEGCKAEVRGAARACARRVSDDRVRSRRGGGRGPARSCPTSRRWRSGSPTSTTSSTRAWRRRCSSACACRSRCCSRARPGVGKTEAAKALAAVLDTPLIRLQCYEGIDAAEALYEWNYPRQLLSIRLADAGGATLARGGPVRPGLPDPPAAAARARAPGPAAGGAADRRDRPRRRRLRGVPARAARRGERDDPRARHDPRPRTRRSSCSPRTARATCTTRSSAAACTTGSTTRRPSARSRSCAGACKGASQTLAVQVADAVSRHARQRRAEAAGIAEAIDWLAALSLLGVERAGRGGGRPHARLGAQVRRGPGGRSARPASRSSCAAVTDARAFGVETIELDLPPLAGAFEPAPARRRACRSRPARSADFARALALVRPISRRRLYWTARAVLVSDPAQVAAFDARLPRGLRRRAAPTSAFEPDDAARRRRAGRRAGRGRSQRRDAGAASAAARRPRRRAAGRRATTTAPRSRCRWRWRATRSGSPASSFDALEPARARAALPADVAPASSRRRCGARAAYERGRHGRAHRHAPHAARAACAPAATRSASRAGAGASCRGGS